MRAKVISAWKLLPFPKIFTISTPKSVESQNFWHFWQFSNRCWKLRFGWYFSLRNCTVSKHTKVLVSMREFWYSFVSKFVNQASYRIYDLIARRKSLRIVFNNAAVSPFRFWAPFLHCLAFMTAAVRGGPSCRSTFLYFLIASQKFLPQLSRALLA